MNQVVNPQRHQEDNRQYDAYGQRGRNQVDVVRVERFVQKRIARERTAAQPKNQAVGLSDEDVGQDDGEQKGQKVKIQHHKQGKPHQDVGCIAEAGVFENHRV